MAEKNVYWRCSTDSERWVDKGVLNASPSADTDGLCINVDQTVRYQTLTDRPWGGCFNERGWKAMEKLPGEQKSKIVGSLFGKDGLGLTVGRMPLGNSDFSINRSQSYNELPAGTETDYNLEHFSIDSDRQYLLPYIKEAKKHCPGLVLWGSPWSPPSWMKTNKTIYGGGNIIWDERILKTYAMYFVEYVKAYRKEGLNVYMVMPQNEPTMSTAYSSCVWTGEQLNVFIRDYLAPALKENGLSEVEIYLGTFTDSNSGLVYPTVNDPVTRKLINGIGFQWWSTLLAKRMYRSEKTELVFMQSETLCGGGENDWKYAEEQFDLMKEFFESGIGSYMLWNMILDEKGENTAPNPWHQNSPIVVHSETGEVIYNPQYHQFRHFSAYIRPLAGRIKTEGSFSDAIAFQNPDGENVLVVKNSSDTGLPVTISFNGSSVSPVLPPHSISTFRTDGEVTAFEDATYLSGFEDAAEEETAVKLINLKSGKALSVRGAAFEIGAEVIQWDNQGTADQTWTLRPYDEGYFNLVNFNSLRALGINGGSKEAGARAIQWDNDNSPNQRWRLEPVQRGKRTLYRLVNLGSSLCLAFENESGENGANAVQMEYNGSDGQLWEAVVVLGGSALTD